MPEVIDVIPKESKSKIGRLNNLGFENQTIKEICVEGMKKV